MTPAEELRAAADKLRRLIAAVPSEHWGDRPWHAEECSDSERNSCPCIVAQGERRDFDQPQIPPIQYVADAETSELAAYIAAVGPPVGLAVAEWLDTAAANASVLTWPNDFIQRALTVARAFPGSQP